VAAADLHVVLVSDALEAGPVFGEVGQVDVHAGAQSCAQVGRARRDVAHMVVVEELGTLFDVGSCAAESLKDGTDVGAGLHRDDTQLVFLVDPDEERLGVVVEDAASIGPVAVQVASLEESVSLLEKEVILDELVLDVFLHASERVEGALEISLKCIARFDNSVHDLVSLLIRDSRS